MAYDDSLRGYSFNVHERDGFRCIYCELDGTKSFDSWLSLSRDHLLPPGNRHREEDEFIVTACRFCNGADNLYFQRCQEQGLLLDGKLKAELIELRRPLVKATRSKYHEFWEQHVQRNVQ